MQSDFLLEKAVTSGEESVGTICGFGWQKGAKCVLQIDGGFYAVDKLAIKGEIVIADLTKCEMLPSICIGKNVYDTDGKFLGKIARFEITSTAKIKSVTLDNGKVLSVGQIAKNNDILLVKAPRPKKPKNIDKPSATEEAANANVTAIAEGLPLNSEPTQTMPQKPNQNPKRRYGDFSFLMGKRVDKTILNFLGEVMIKRGEYVTRDVFLQAKKFGKLTELCLHAE